MAETAWRIAAKSARCGKCGRTTQLWEVAKAPRTKTEHPLLCYDCVPKTEGEAVRKEGNS